MYHTKGIGRLGSCRVVFCTITFGMGIDIPDIRCVIHYRPAADIDNYFQELIGENR